MLSVLLKSRQMELPHDRFERFVRGSLGLTENEIKRLYARILLAGGDISGLEHQDLWQRLRRELDSRPSFDIIVRWVKAHTTDDDIAAGIITPRDKRLNDGADDLAKGGAREHHGPE